MKKCMIATILLVLNAAADTVDPRVRTLIDPVRVVWTSSTGGYGGQSVVTGAEKLLGPKHSQIPEHVWGKPAGCLMENRSAPASILLDFGREIHGGIQIGNGEFMHGMKMRVRFGESVGEAMSELGDRGSCNDHSTRDGIHTIPHMGLTEIGNTGFRFVRLDLLTTGKVNLECVRAASLMRPMKQLGEFRSSDPRLNQVFATAVRTVHLCCQEHLWDGIKRDRLVWMGDTHPETRTILAAFGADPVLPESLDFAAATTPEGGFMNGMPNYTLWFLRNWHDWWFFTGDDECLKKRHDYLKKTVELVLANVRGENATYDGGKGARVFLDWPTEHNRPAVEAGTRGLLASALDASAEIMDVVGEAELALRCRSTAIDIRREHPDPAGAKSAAAVLALGGVRDAKEMYREVLGRNGHDGVSTFYGYYMLEAMSAAGENQRALVTVRDYWGGMLDMGATSFWEDFNLAWTNGVTRLDEMPVPGRKDIHGDFGEFCYPGYRHSFCHGWSSGPAAWILEHVLGVTIVGKGGSEVRVAPFLGDLEWCEGAYPTPRGVVKVSVRKRPDSTLDVKIDAPKGTKIVR